MVTWGDKKIEPMFYDTTTHESAVKAMAWNPNHEGLIATGGGIGD